MLRLSNSDATLILGLIALKGDFFKVSVIQGLIALKGLKAKGIFKKINKCGEEEEKCHAADSVQQLKITKHLKLFRIKVSFSCTEVWKVFQSLDKQFTLRQSLVQTRLQKFLTNNEYNIIKGQIQDPQQIPVRHI